MMSYAETKRAVESVLAEPPRFEGERLPSAACDWARLMPTILSEVSALTSSPEESLGHNRSYRIALRRAASMECAAGVSLDRCRTWFRCVASLAAWAPPGVTQAVSIAECAVWAALAGWFDAAPPGGWPDDCTTEATSERVLYRLLTRKAIEMHSPRTLFENRLWEDLCRDIEEGQDILVEHGFQSLAAWWLEEYEACETPPYDPEHFSTFEPAPNAALAIASCRDGMRVRFNLKEHERFFYVARMLVEAESAGA